MDRYIKRFCYQETGMTAIDVEAVRRYVFWMLEHTQESVTAIQAMCVARFPGSDHLVCWLISDWMD